MRQSRTITDRPSGPLRRFAILAAGALLAGCLAEIVLRQMYWVPNVADPDFGFVMQPDTEAHWCIEGCARSRWTRDGLRRTAPFDPARPSLLALGDSFTEGLMVDDDDVYTHRLERLLAGGPAPLQVLNAGKSGASAADYVALADRYLARFAPRWTVIELREGDLASDAFDASKTHFRAAADGHLETVLIPSLPGKWTRHFAGIRRRSALANYAVARVNEFAGASAQEPPLFRAASARRSSAQAPPPSDATIEAELALLRAAYAERVTFVWLPDYPARPGAPGSTPGPAERVLARLCSDPDWSCVNLRDAFGQFAERAQAPYGFPNTGWNWGHLNAVGHRALADLLRAEIERLRGRALL